VVSDSSDEEEPIALEWRPGRQYWWTNEYDPSKDRRGGEGYQIELVGPENTLEKMEASVRWSQKELKRPIGVLFNIASWQRVIL
jgi:hypothetical protein